MNQHVPLDVAAVSHPGRVRSHNEDAIFVDAVAGLAVLADGMGGCRAGEVASGIAVDHLAHTVAPELKIDSDLAAVDNASGLTRAGALLSRQIYAANKAILTVGHERPECRGMGTTIVAGVFRGEWASIGHVGDSRCYRLRRDTFQQLTRDHSLLQEQVDSGLLTPEEAQHATHRNVVTRALGIDEAPVVDVVEYRLEIGDVYLFCSDGLTDMVEPETIGTMVRSSSGNLAAAAMDLVERANENGGRDNVSVVLVGIPAGFLPETGWVRRLWGRCG